MVDAVWVLAAFNVGLLLGGGMTLLGVYASRRYGRPVPRPYRNPILTSRPSEELEAAQAAAGEAGLFKFSEAELQGFAQSIMREAGVDEGAARKEVDMLLAQAGELGQG